MKILGKLQILFSTVIYTTYLAQLFLDFIHRDCFFNNFCCKWSRIDLSLSTFHLSRSFLDPNLPCLFQIIFSTVKNELNFLDLVYHRLDHITDQALGLIYPRLFQIQLCAPQFLLKHDLSFFQPKQTSEIIYKVPDGYKNQL